MRLNISFTSTYFDYTEVESYIFVDRLKCVLQENIDIKKTAKMSEIILTSFLSCKSYIPLVIKYIRITKNF